MKKCKIKNKRTYNNEKGITLITLVVAVSIMIIISGMLIYNAKNGIKMRNLKMMQNDIDLLDNKVDSYYVKYGALPAEIEYNVTPLPFESYKSPNDNDKYYVLDLKAFEGLTLNYGADFASVTAENVADYTDLYVINEQSHYIYYVRGIEMDGVWYYTNNDEDEKVEIKQLGSYLVDEITYTKTLKKALEASKDGSTIKVIKDVQENAENAVTKNIILDTNGKKINIDNNKIIIASGAKFTINGTGSIINNETGPVITNNGELEINDVTIYAAKAINLSGTIYNNGTLIINEGNITNGEEYGIFNYKNVTINGGNIGKIRTGIGSESSHDDYITINNGTIENILFYYGTGVINGGTINELVFEHSDVIIGNKNQEVNSTNPEIKNLNLPKDGEIIDPGTYAFEFANGIIKSKDANLFEGVIPDLVDVQVRSGHYIKNTYNSVTGYYEYTLAEVELATSIIVDPTSAEIIVGDTQILTATVSPDSTTNKDVTWTSSNTEVATISTTGVVTAKTAGTTTITVKTKDGSNKSASCTITVIPEWSMAFSNSVCSGTLMQPASTSTPTILTIDATTTQHIYADLYYNRPINDGDTISITYMYTRSDNSYYFDLIVDGTATRPTYGLTSGLNPENAGTTMKFTKTVTKAASNCLFRLAKSDAPTSQDYYIKLYIYDITINGKKVL